MKRKFLNRRTLYATAGVVILGTVAFFLLGSSDKQPAVVPTGQLTRTVKIARGDLELMVSANGVVQPIDRVEIKSKASGQIEVMKFEEGDLVQKGSLLIELDRTTATNDFDQAKADLAVAESNLRQQSNNHDRSIELFSKNLISEQERDQVILEKVRAEAQLVKAKAAVSSADERLRDTRIISPITGVILTRDVSLGQIISSGVSNVSGGTLLATIADMTEVHVATNVDEVDIGKVQVGQRARVVADAFPDDVFLGEVVRIAPLGKTQQNVTTFNVIVLVRNLGGRLKAGMSASVDIEIFKRQSIVLVPTEALVNPRTDQGRAMLAVLRERNPGDSSLIAINPASADPNASRERFASMTPEEQQTARAQMRQRVQNMSEQERQRFFSNMRQQSGGGRGDGMRGGTGSRRHPETQSSVRQRVVEVRDGKEFVPRVVKIGVGNYDYSEVLEGLNEGDEIRITTISRAKIASEQFNERIRASQSMGGISGGATRAATGSGRR